MTRLLYFDCFSGISGDMLLGALLDAGLPIDALRGALGSLAIEGYGVTVEKVSRAGVAATKFRVSRSASAAPAKSAVGSHNHGHSHEDHDAHHEHASHGHESEHADGHSQAGSQLPMGSHAHDHRTLPEIYRLIDDSALSSHGKDRARGLFGRLAEVEAAIHEMPIERVHLHEVGELDSIIDIVGAVFGLEWFGAARIVCSPLNVGGGMVDSAHGRFPVPAPATLRLLQGIPIYSSGMPSELVTPTGALLAAGYASEFGPVPAMTVDAVGYGAGDRNPAGTPNVLRVLVGEGATDPSTERVLLIECEIDDMSPQIFGLLMDRLHEAGALDVYFSPVQMKKNRPGTLLSIVARPGDREAISHMVFRETTTLGLRYHAVERERLQREIVTVVSPFGSVRIKVARRNGSVMNAAPEFEDCARLAAEHGVPLKHVQAATMKAYLDSSVVSR